MRDMRENRGEEQARGKRIEMRDEDYKFERR